LSKDVSPMSFYFLLCPLMSVHPIFGASSGKCCYLIKNTQQANTSNQVKSKFVARNMSNEV